MRLLLLVLATLIVSTPVINGETSIGGGLSVSVGETGSAQGVFSANGEYAKSVMIADGVKSDVDQEHWVQNARGDFAKVGINLRNAGNYTYNYYMSGEGVVQRIDSVWAEEYLDVTSADYIKAYAEVSTPIGDDAKANIEITDGFLYGYVNSVYIGPYDWWSLGGAYVSQSAEYATGSSILIQTTTQNWYDSASAETTINNGLLYGYSANANSYLNAYYGDREVGVAVNRLIAFAPQGSINQNLWATSWGDSCRVGTYINKGNVESSYANAYTSSYSKSISASQSVTAESAGSENYISSNSYIYSTLFGENNYSHAYNSQLARFSNSVSTGANGMSQSIWTW